MTHKSCISRVKSEASFQTPTGCHSRRSVVDKRSSKPSSAAQTFPDGFQC